MYEMEEMEDLENQIRIYSEEINYFKDCKKHMKELENNVKKI